MVFYKKPSKTGQKQAFLPQKPLFFRIFQKNAISVIGINAGGSSVCSAMNFSIQIRSYHLPNLYQHLTNLPTGL